MREFALAWYGFLNSLYAAVSAPFGGLTSGGGSLLTALLLGLLGALSPCQLSTNASSITYLMVGRGRDGRKITWPATAYIAGKVLVYSLAGLAALLLGEGLRAAAIPTVVVARKVLGPLMILIGLAFLGVWQPRMAFGHALSFRLRDRAAGPGALRPLLLGVAFSFAFCPTLALLFFGYVIPMAAASAAGPVYPAAFAVGTTFPLIFAALVMTLGSDSANIEARVASWQPWIRRVAGSVFLLAGLNDTFLYWLL